MLSIENIIWIIIITALAIPGIYLSKRYTNGGSKRDIIIYTLIMVSFAVFYAYMEIIGLGLNISPTIYRVFYYVIFYLVTRSVPATLFTAVLEDVFYWIIANRNPVEYDAGFNYTYQFPQTDIFTLFIGFSLLLIVYGIIQNKIKIKDFKKVETLIQEYV